MTFGSQAIKSKFRRQINGLWDTINSWKCPKCRSFFTTKCGTDRGAQELTFKYMRQCKEEKCKTNYMVEPRK